MRVARSSVVGWCFVAVLCFPFTLLLGLGTHSRAVILTSFVLVLLRMVAWTAFRHFWRRAESRRLAEASSRLTTIAESCHELLWETRGAYISYLAPSVKAYLGYEPHELLGEPAAAIFAVADRPRARALLESCSVSGRGWTDEVFTFTTRDGEPIRLLSTGLAQTDADGTVIGFAGTLRRLDGWALRQRRGQLTQQILDVIDEPAIIGSVFQPIVDSFSEVAIGAEALTRFPVQGTLISTDQWFTAATEVGLSCEFEIACLRKALTVASATLPPNLFLSVNVSPATMLRVDLAGVIGDCGWELERIVLEITEHVSINDYATLTARIDALRRLGARLAVDDAGAGYASFRHILALKPDFIKLDRELITCLDTDPGKRALVRAVGTFAGEIGATLIGEGVETGSELLAACLLGVHVVQGFFIAKPSQVDAWPQRLRTPNRAGDLPPARVHAAHN
jgi:PAS domain S-box-containing protein